MRSGDSSNYVPAWPIGASVRVSLKGHGRFGQRGTIVAALPNPSKHREYQWYDIQFDPGIYGRFLEKQLDRVVVVSETRTA
jgi:hypothetical protein